MKSKVRRELHRAISFIITFLVAFSLCFCCSAFETDAASYYAEDIVNYANSQVGSSQPAGMCMGWVNGAFNSVYGWERQGCCAYTYGSQIKVDTRQDNIPLGALVYFQYTDSYPYGKVTDYCGNYAGHIGIYVGNGKMVHTFDWADGKGTRVCKNSISDIAKPGLYRYCGWGWYNKTSLDQGSKTEASTPAKKTATVKLETLDGELVQESAYGSWGDVKTTTTRPAESDTLRITDTSKKTQYKYYHYHNAYDGTQMMIDSISYTGNWGYCEMYKDSALSNTMSFQDKGGKTSVKKGDGCQYGYTLWFEDVKAKTVYSYQERTKNASVSDTIKIGEDRVISVLPDAEKDGDSLICWNTKADGSGVSYYPGENVVFGQFTADACYVLYAIYEDTSIETPEEEPELTKEPEEIKIPAETVSPVADSSNGISVYYNGKKMSFDVSPQIINSRTMVPMRNIFETFGMKVQWDDKTKTVTASNGESVIVMVIGCDYFTKNGEKIYLDSPATIVNSRTLVPGRAISEALDLYVYWDGDTRTVYIQNEKRKISPAEVMNKYYEAGCNLQQYIPKDQWDDTYNGDFAEVYISCFDTNASVNASAYIPEMYVVLYSARGFIRDIYAFYYNDNGFSHTKVDLYNSNGATSMFVNYKSNSGNDRKCLLNSEYLSEDYHTNAQDLQLVQFDLNNDRIWTQPLIQTGKVQYPPDVSITSEEMVVYKTIMELYHCAAEECAWGFYFDWLGSRPLQYGSIEYKEYLKTVLDMAFS